MFQRMSAIMMSLAVLSLVFLTQPAHAATSTVRQPLRSGAYQYALAQHGKWYCWGGTGPSCYDCSGLVYTAYQHVHISLGRTTYDMLRSGRLTRISHAQARRGDLAFFGTGHVELFDRANITFGAHNTGTRIGWAWYNAYWYPTAFYRVKGAG
jgi:cell wall-associated NlpC family hydrolase